MKNIINITSLGFLIATGVAAGGGLALALGVTPSTPNDSAQSFYPSTNNTFPNFNNVLIDTDESTDEKVAINGNGISIISNLIGSINNDELESALDISTINAGGISSEGMNSGVFTETNCEDGFCTKYGMMSDLKYNNEDLISYSGFLEEDVNYSSPENNIVQNQNEDNVRLDKGVPYAFYTDDKSIFNGDIEAVGNIISDTIETPKVEIQNGNMYVNETGDYFTAEDFIIEADMNTRFHIKKEALMLDDASVAYVEASCEENEVLLGCNGGLQFNAAHAAEKYGMTGVEKNDNNGCRARVESVTTSIPSSSDPQLYVDAFCFAPN